MGRQGLGCKNLWDLISPIQVIKKGDLNQEMKKAMSSKFLANRVKNSNRKNEIERSHI
jgi:hypothetical protein